MIRAVVFDLDDTLVDSWSRFDAGMLSVLDAEGVSYDREEMIATIHPQGVSLTAALFCTLGVPGTVDEVTRRLEEGMYREYAHHIRLMPGVEEYLRRLRANGVRLFVLTASPHSIADPCLHNNGVFDWFDQVWTVEDYGMGKSDPRLFTQVVENMGVPADRILYFDDNPVAVANAALAGMQVCGVLCAHTPHNAEKIPQIAERYIASFEELLK